MHVKDSSGVVVKVVLALLGILYVRAYILLYSYLFVYLVDSTNIHFVILL